MKVRNLALVGRVGVLSAYDFDGEPKVPEIYKTKIKSEYDGSSH